MKQGEIWQADLNPVKGSEQQGVRPVVIVSGNSLNQYLQVVIACSLTTKIKEYKDNVILKPDQNNGLSKRSEIMVFRIRSISKVKLTQKIGEITREQLNALKQGLDDILGY